MCWVEKFCLCVPLNLGCVLLGVWNIILSTVMLTAVVFKLVSQKKLEMLIASHENEKELFSLNITASTLTMLGYAVILVGALCIFTSIILIVGIFRNNSSCVLTYFFFGIILVIISQLSALLVILNGCWELSIIIFVISLVYIHFQVGVYTVYDLMQRGRDFRFRKLQDDDDNLLGFENEN